MLLRLGVAAGVAAVALDGGSYAVVPRLSLAVLVWWGLLVAVAFGLWEVRLTKTTLACATPLGAIVVWSGASALWAASTERAVAELDRNLLYLGVLLLAATSVRASHVAAAIDGLLLGLLAVACTALASRLFPDVFPASDVPSFLPGTEKRLMYPVDYWNGLGVLVGFAVPLSLRTAVVARRAAARSAALATLPIVAATIFLTSSRGGVAAALIGGMTYAILTRRKGAVALAALAGAVASAAAVAVLLAHPVLLDGPFAGEAAIHAGRRAALLLVLLVAVFWTGTELAVRRSRPQTPGLGRWVAVVTGAAAVIAFVASDPVSRARAFTSEPVLSRPEEGFVTSHLLGAGGSGRWQFWSTAIEQFKSRPLIGQGAGSYESWWAEHGTVPIFVRDAHSLYLETLGELGLVGFALLAAWLAAALAAVRSTVRSERNPSGEDAAAAGGVIIAFAAAAALDWMWELTVVGAVAFTALGLVLALRTSSPIRLSGAFRISAALTCAFAVVLEGVPLLGRSQLEDSRAAAGRGDTAAALASASRARDLEPWAASPRLQLALVHERRGEIAAARAAIGEAIRRDPRDWRLWLVDARLATVDGDLADARGSLAQARQLNPRSPHLHSE